MTNEERDLFAESCAEYNRKMIRTFRGTDHCPGSDAWLGMVTGEAKREAAKLGTHVGHSAPRMRVQIIRHTRHELAPQRCFKCQRLIQEGTVWAWILGPEILCAQCEPMARRYAAEKVAQQFAEATIKEAS